MSKPIKHLTLSAKDHPELMAKLNVVSRFHYKSVHETARNILNEYLDSFVNDNGIDYSTIQSAMAG